MRPIKSPFSKLYASAVIATLFAMNLASCATVPKGVIVDITVSPENILPEEVGAVSVRDIDGDGYCAAPLKNMLESLINKAAVYELDISGLEDPETTVIIEGKIEECNIKPGYGNVSATFVMFHDNRRIHIETDSENSNRPGASKSEVRDVLLKRLAKKYASRFLPVTRKELRIFKKGESHTAAISSAENRNWDMAIRLWTELIIKNRKNHQAFYNRGIAYEAGGGVKNLERAIRDYKTAIAIKKDSLYIKALSRAENALLSLKKAIELKEKIGDG